MNKTLPAKLSICRFQGGTRDEGVSIRVTDKKSGCCVLELEMSIEEFGRAILGLSERPGVASWKTKVLGLQREHKTEFVLYDPKKQTKEQALEPYEKDGWKGREEDLNNYNKHGYDANGRDGFNIVFVRYVKDEK